MYFFQVFLLVGLLGTPATFGHTLSDEDGNARPAGQCRISLVGEDHRFLDEQKKQVRGGLNGSQFTLIEAGASEKETQAAVYHLFDKERLKDPQKYLLTKDTRVFGLDNSFTKLAGNLPNLRDLTMKAAIGAGDIDFELSLMAKIRELYQANPVFHELWDLMKQDPKLFETARDKTFFTAFPAGLRLSIKLDSKGGKDVVTSLDKFLSDKSLEKELAKLESEDPRKAEAFIKLVAHSEFDKKENLVYLMVVLNNMTNHYVRLAKGPKYAALAAPLEIDLLTDYIISPPKKDRDAKILKALKVEWRDLAFASTIVDTVPKAEAENDKEIHAVMGADHIPGVRKILEEKLKGRCVIEEVKPR